MLSIGIGGQIGSGKTSVVNELVKLYRKDNFTTKLIDADRIAWSLYKQGTDSKIYKKIVGAFGEDVLKKNGEVNRKKLGSVVFSNRVKLQKLNKIIHPELTLKIGNELRTPDADVKILDAALLFFWGKKIKVDYHILVTAPEKTKVARMVKRGYNPLEVKARLKNQMKESDMEKMTDFIVNNNGTLAELRNKIKTLYKIISGS